MLLSPGRVTQVFSYRRSVGDLAWIENIGRIPGLFKLLEQSVVMLPEHQRDELTPQPAVTVLTAQRAAVFFHQVRQYLLPGCEKCLCHPDL